MTNDKTRNKDVEDKDKDKDTHRFRDMTMTRDKTRDKNKDKTKYRPIWRQDNDKRQEAGQETKTKDNRQRVYKRQRVWKGYSSSSKSALISSKS